jgi:hypothetical protein
MNPTEAGRILAVAIGFDPKMPQPDPKGFLRGIWADALGAVAYDDAYRVVIEYYTSDWYREKRESISPADIVVGVRRLRSVGPAPAYQALPPANPASNEVRLSAMAAAREVFARLPHLAAAAKLPKELHPLGPKVARIQRQASAADDAIAALDQLATRKPDSTPEGA